MHAEKYHELRRMKAAATGLLVAVTALFILAHSQQSQGLWAWLAAFAEAAMIGALADWFAVVALFKRPLGLPIPHTAILPRNKDRIAQNIAVFVRDKFLAPSILLQKIEAYQPLDKLAAWLSHEANAQLSAQYLHVFLVRALDFIDDSRVQQALRHLLLEKAQGFNLGETIGRLVDVLTEDQRHQALLDSALHKLADALEQPDNQKAFASMILEVSGREYPHLVAMLGMMTDPNEFSLKVANALVGNVNRWLRDITQDPHHPRRAQFDEVVAQFLEKVKQDPAFHQKINHWKNHLLASHTLSVFIEGLWLQAKDWLRQDLSQLTPSLQTKIANALQGVATWFQANPSFKTALAEQISLGAQAVLGEFRNSLTTHISSTIQQWQDDRWVQEVEVSVGKDLQYIRINGALVGGLVGVLLYAIRSWVPFF